MTAPEQPVQPVRGDVLLHPVALGAIVVLLLNDHVLKERWGNTLTGKLSDLAGLVFFPLLLVAVVEVRPGGHLAGRRTILASVVLTGAAFAAVQLIPAAGTTYEWAWGVLRWPIDTAAAGLDGVALPTLQPVRLWPDATDLLALPALAIAYLVGRSARPTAGRPKDRSRPARRSRTEACETGTPLVRAGSSAG